MRDKDVIIHAVLQAKPSHEGMLAAVLLEAQRGARSEPGCVTYQMAQDLEAPDTFHAFEIWDSEESFSRHLAGQPFQNFRGGLSDCGRLVHSTRWTGQLEPYVPSPAGATA